MNTNINKRDESCQQPPALQTTDILSQHSQSERLEQIIQQSLLTQYQLSTNGTEMVAATV